MRAKEACDILEDLKDMLLEKSLKIEELVKRKKEAESEMWDSVKLEFIGHISDIFKEG